LEKTQIRSLTLIAKTIQNLGNLVEFGMKEPYMKDVNPFILSKMEGVKKFIDQISVLFLFFFLFFSFLLLLLL